MRLTETTIFTKVFSEKNKPMHLKPDSTVHDQSMINKNNGPL